MLEGEAAQFEARAAAAEAEAQEGLAQREAALQAQIADQKAAGEARLSTVHAALEARGFDAVTLEPVQRDAARAAAAAADAENAVSQMRASITARKAAADGVAARARALASRNGHPAAPVAPASFEGLSAAEWAEAVAH